MSRIKPRRANTIGIIRLPPFEEKLAVIYRKNRKLTSAMKNFIHALKQPIGIPSPAGAGEGGAAG
jgi:hypothetical protein